MKTRDVVIFSGQRFQVPQCIQRIDHRYTHGWQVRNGGTKMFSDGSNDGSGAQASLEAAIRELIQRIATLPTPTKLQLNPSNSKGSDLPVGISGPLVRQRRGTRSSYASFQVLLPRFGEKPRNKNVYIGSHSTYTKERYKEALDRAIDLRREAEEAYRVAESKSRRAEARELKKALAATKSAGKVNLNAALKAVSKPAKAAKAPAKAAKAPAKAVKAAAKGATAPAKAPKAAAKPAKAAAKAPKAAKAPARAAQAAKAPAKAVKAAKPAKAAVPAAPAKAAKRVAKAAAKPAVAPRKAGAKRAAAEQPRAKAGQRGQ